MEKFVALPSGHKMPILGLGTSLSSDEKEIEIALNAALEAGYRHIDTAYLYENEEQIGKVLRHWIDSGKIKRDELFIVTKLPGIGNSPDRVPHFLKLSLEALQLDYVDLYLMHFPFGLKYVNDKELWPKDNNGDSLLDMRTDLVANWKAMEQRVDAGKAKSIGISNFDEDQVERIAKVARIPISILQVELQIYNQQRSLRKVCSAFNIPICAFAPFGSPGRAEFFAKRGVAFTPPTILADPVVKEIADRLEKTTAQVLLRFVIQQNIIVIPKSSNPARIRANFDVFDFELSSEDMKNLSVLDKGDKGRNFTYEAFRGVDRHPECPEWVRDRTSKTNT